MAPPKFNLDDAFDRTGKLRAPPISGMMREAWALQTYAPARPDPATLPHGKGRAVLVIPAFLTDDAYTRGLRDYLTRCGFRSYGAQIGTNWGPTEKIVTRLRQRLVGIRQETTSPICLVGISLGGLLARGLALEYPNDTEHVVTIASPISLPTATNLELLIRLCARCYSPNIAVQHLSSPLPMAWTSIYSKRDGLIAWQSCLSDAPGGICIEVDAPHIAMARNPEALKALVMRLAGVPYSS